MIGTTLSHFKITAKLGEGGMGEVYRAEDSKLGREVAIKVLPEAFTADPERFARFEREARVLASLNHPHIAGIYDLAEDGETHFLVLELVDGEDLAERLSRGGLPMTDAVSVSLQIAEALEAAHGKGVVHRDLKPGNVMISAEGSAKVLDFGLAKNWAPEGDEADLTHSPTLTSPMTQTGVIMGTAAYMSPEQARGQAVDKQADIWAFGCVLYEMLTGSRAFARPTVTETLAAVLEREVDWEALPIELPPLARSVLRRCLEKDPKRRLHDIADARLELEEALRDTDQAGAPTLAVNPVSGGKGTLLAFLAGVAIATLTVAGWLATRPAAQPPAVRRFELQPPPGVELQSGSSSGLALSPDGTLVAFAGFDRGESRRRIYLRSVEDLETTPLPGTEGGFAPFFSPDGQWLGFWSDGAIRKVSLAGGEPLRICDSQIIKGASWGEGGMIVFSGESGGLSAVDADGGLPANITTPDADAGELNHRWPEWLPGGRAVLFNARVGLRDSSNRIEVISLESGERKALWTGGTDPHYLRSGHLVYSIMGSVYAVPFDTDRLAMRGSPRAVLQDVRSGWGGNVRMAVSTQGSMVYIPGVLKPPDVDIVSVYTNGGVEPLLDSSLPYESPRYSPDGRHLAVTIHRSIEDADIWIYDLGRGTRRRLTTEGAYHPTWSPDGEHIVFTSPHDGPWQLFRIRSDGSTPPDQLTTPSNLDFPGSFTPDGRSLLFQRITPPNPWGLMEVDLSKRGEISASRLELENAYQPRLSPDGRWLAYSSPSSGRPEIYLRPYGGTGASLQVSLDGGFEPVWHPAGTELFFSVGTPSAGTGGAIMSVPVSPGPELSVGKPRLVVDVDFDFTSTTGWTAYDISPDAQRFVMARRPELSDEASRLVFVPYWADEIEQILSGPGGE